MENQSKLTMTQILKSLESHYAKGEFTQAIELLTEHQSEFAPGQFHFNLGTLYIKTQQFPLARYHLEAAKALGHNSIDTWKNLQQVETKFGSNPGSCSLEAWPECLDQLHLSLASTSGDFYWLCALSTVLLALIFLKKTLTLGLKKHKIILGLTLGVLLSFWGGLWAYKKGLHISIVLVDSPVREGASEVFDQSLELPAGSKLLTKSPENGWYYIFVPSQYRGWIQAANIKVVP